MEAEHRLILLQHCFHTFKTTQANAPPEEKKQQNCHHKAACLLLPQMAQNDTLGKIISKMRDNKLTFEQTLFKMPKNERPYYLAQQLKVVSFLENNHLLRIEGKLQVPRIFFQFPTSCTSSLPTLNFRTLCRNEA